MKLEKIAHDFSVCKVEDYSQVKGDGEFSFLQKTDEENSLVCITEDVPKNVLFQEDGWKAFRIQGELDFSLVGILSKLLTILAEHNIGIFAISTYNTDYILIKKESYEEALEILAQEGYDVL